jgi:diguanylate cyclase (GGDEF)-like protein
MLKLKHLQERLRDAQRRLEEQSVTDALTGLKNRRFFDERLHEEFRRAQRYGDTLSLIMIDLDHFKAVNDEHGHAAGDAVLRDLAECAVRMLRQQDLFARFGGEEFVVLVPETDAEGACIVAERLRKVTKGRIVQVGDRRIAYDFSAGVATLRAEDAGVDATIKRADEALYAAKRGGRGRTVGERTAG